MLFADVLGQDEWKKKLIHEVRNNKVAHAQMFLGNFGNGTLELALAYAQFLMCTNPTATDACGVCSACRKVSGLIHPDLHMIYPVYEVAKKSSKDFAPEWRSFLNSSSHASFSDWMYTLQAETKQFSIATKESVEINKAVALKPYEGGKRVLLIWKAELMNLTFANKVLKLFEEPPKDTVIILLVEDQDQILPTILSRTQIKKIGKIEEETILKVITENHSKSHEEALSLTLRAERNWGQILQLLDNEDYSETNRLLFIEMMRTCYKKNVLEMMDCSDKLADLSKEGQRSFLQYALYMFRQSLMKNYTGEALFQASNKEAEFLKNFSRFITGNNIVGMMESFNDGIFHLQRNANARILFTQLCFKVMRFIHFA